MKKNVAYWDRILRYGLGLLLLTWAMIGGPFWAYLGFYPLATASWGFCPVYFLLRTLRENR
ncbi:MAG: DUF2892 domain-containing protein [Bdellovibrionales bacterium]|nr:DUF2892 domain-containing protein [Bdellovibrionales bacterium]